jgi:hypothetical protein
MKRVLLLLTLIFSQAFISAQTTFILKQTLSLTASDDPYAIATGDIDKDGHDDILFASSGNGTFSWLKNDGSGNFGTPMAIGAVNGSGPVLVSNIDAGSTPDVAVSAYDGNEVVWFDNDGSGNF